MKSDEQKKKASLTIQKKWIIAIIIVVLIVIVIIAVALKMSIKSHESFSKTRNMWKIVNKSYQNGFLGIHGVNAIRDATAEKERDPDLVLPWIYIQNAKEWIMSSRHVTQNHVRMEVVAQ